MKTTFSWWRVWLHDVKAAQRQWTLIESYIFVLGTKATWFPCYYYMKKASHTLAHTQIFHIFLNWVIIFRYHILFHLIQIVYLSENYLGQWKVWRWCWHRQASYMCYIYFPFFEFNSQPKKKSLLALDKFHHSLVLLRFWIDVLAVGKYDYRFILFLSI